ncbi:hypothetical protein ANN_27208 [Periplaneta americana]|uniref:Uncharacterized protein n=1 Tax=Periplaneta americana TaxID=6978 RepID=A0ABQ8RXL4_PERAM|nr:hypothetical protein ANN_27208 [Periplaneta americana]
MVEKILYMLLSSAIPGSRSGSPVMAEACQTTSQKRKLQPDDDDDDEVKESDSSDDDFSASSESEDM